MNENFVAVLKHSIEDRGFIEGKDFINVDTNEYYILLPFVFEILHPFGKIYGGKYKLFHHCVTNEKQHFKHYYDEQFVKMGRLKCFFFNKKNKNHRYGTIQYCFFFKNKTLYFMRIYLLVRRK